MYIIDTYNSFYAAIYNHNVTIKVSAKLFYISLFFFKYEGLVDGQWLHVCS